jgi:hypothetical protein
MWCSSRHSIIAVIVSIYIRTDKYIAVIECGGMQHVSCLLQDKIVVLLLDIILDLQIDELLRFRKVERHGEGVANLLTAEESKKSIEMAMTGWKVRSELSNKIGKGRYVIAEYERIKRITMPFGEDYLLYLTTEPQANHLNIINRIRKLEAGLKYSFS